MSNTTTTPTSIPYYWIKRLLPEIAQLDSIPQLGYLPSFPWKDFEAEFAKHFELEGFKIQASDPEWRTQDTLYQGIGKPTSNIYGVISHLEGFWCLAMTQEDLYLLLSSLINKHQSPLTLVDTDFLQGFSHFIALETINIFTHLDFDKELVPRITEREEEITGSAFCMDLTINIGESNAFARLMLSQDLHRTIKERYSERKAMQPLAASLAEKMMATIHVEVAKTMISYEEWSRISLGDMLILDKFSSKGRVTLTVNRTPLFRGKIKDGALKILESPLYYEVEANMTMNSSNSENPEAEEGVDEDFEEGFDEELGEEEIEENETSDETDPNHHIDDTHEAPMSTNASKGESPAKLQDLPLTVVVEVGRLQMSIQKLLDLKPGNLLELDMKPENGVDLVINDRLVGRGELVLVGETLGVRILDLG